MVKFGHNYKSVIYGSKKFKIGRPTIQLIELLDERYATAQPY